MPRYSDWPETQNGQVFKGENYPVGKGLGIISPKNFEPATWTPLLKSATGQGQYGRFIALMMGRINLQESPPDEVRNFVNMVTSDVSHDLLYYALPHMPDWTKGPPRDPYNFPMALCYQQMLTKTRERMNQVAIRDREAFERTKIHLCPGQTMYQNGLCEEEINYLRRLAFAPNPGATHTPAMDRLFKSWIDFAYNQASLDRTMAEAKARGTDIERDIMGLPLQLRLPEPPTQQPSQVRAPAVAPAGPPTAPLTATSTATTSTAATSTTATTAKTPTTATTTTTATSAGPSRITSLSPISEESITNDDPPAELLVGVADGTTPDPDEGSVTPKARQISHTDVARAVVTKGKAVATAPRSNAKQHSRGVKFAHQVARRQPKGH